MRKSIWLSMIVGVMLFLFENSNVWAELPPVSVCFTPQQYCEGKVLALIYSAEHSIRMQSYSFTLYKVAHALVSMKRKGVDVQVIMDKSQFQCGQFSQAAYLIQHGVPVFNDHDLDIAHSKVIIVDGQQVETGSFNYTNAAQHYNAENLVFIQSVDIAKQYLQNWEARRAQSTPVTTTACIPNSGSQDHHVTHFFGTE